MKKQIFIYIYLAFSVFFITEISFSAQKGKPNNKNKSLLKIRKKPNKKAAILAKVKDGEEFDVISTNQKGWHNVNFKGVKGWANGKYVEVTGVPDENNNTDNEKELPESAKKVPDIIETSLKAQIKNLGATDNKAEVDYTIPDDFADDFEQPQMRNTSIRTGFIGKANTNFNNNQNVDLNYNINSNLDLNLSSNADNLILK